MSAPLYLGLATFMAALVAHIAWWRVRRPRNDVVGLFVVFLLAPTLAWLGAWLAGAAAASSLIDVSALLLLHVAASCAYIQTYPAMQAVSPTLYLIGLLQDAPPEGLPLAELDARLDARAGLIDRFGDLENMSLVSKRDGRYYVSGVGRGVIACLRVYRGLLGMESSRG